MNKAPIAIVSLPIEILAQTQMKQKNTCPFGEDINMAFTTTTTNALTFASLYF